MYTQYTQLWLNIAPDIDELSIIKLYQDTTPGKTREETLSAMWAVEVELLEPEELRRTFCSARDKLSLLTPEEYAALDFSDVLIAEEDE